MAESIEPRSMELRAFAEQVLFAESLEEKLALPAGMITDECPSRALLTPESPGRPQTLRMAPRGERAELPPERDLEKDGPRAVLLHFFANHELLATELMALAILKFPDAPPRFRRALLQTMKEEQVHTRLYMERMARCGLTFGDLPVNGFFWRHVADMESPMDYVSRLSLTFEQANLDYARHYSATLGRMGDADSAALLDRIYKDEIGHVGVGLHWFRKWKQGDQSDWEAWRRVLRFPMNPARARGAGAFNAEGRRRSGLDEEFIKSLEVFSKSRGRSPDVYLFNPGAETCAATRDAAAAQMEKVSSALARDLDLLPLLLCSPEDVVLVQRLPSAEHLRELKRAGIAPAEFELLQQGRVAGDSPLRKRSARSLKPWGWSADSASVLSALEGSRESIVWNDAVRGLYAKSAAAALLAGLSAEMPDAAVLAGRVAQSAAEVATAISHWRGMGFSAAALKAPWGLAGRSMMRLDAEPNPKQQEWIEGILLSQGALVVEPWLERAADFSAHYDVSADGGVKLRGMVRLFNDTAGRFIACAASRNFSRLLTPEVARALHACGAQEFYRDVLPQRLAALIRGSGFRGWLGVDAFLHREKSGTLRIRPVVEINPRCTMGRVTLEARRLISPESPAAWRIFYQKHVKGAGCAGLPEFAAQLHRQYPVACDETGRLRHGAVCITDPATASDFLGVLFAGSAAEMAIVDTSAVFSSIFPAPPGISSRTIFHNPPRNTK